MNLGSANVVVRPRAVRESLDLAFPFLLRLGGVRYLRFAACVLLPAFGACLGLLRWLELSWGMIWFIALPIGLWLQGMFTLAAGELMFSERLAVRPLLRRFARSAPSYTWALLTAGVITSAISLTVALAPWACVRALYVPEASLLENVRAGRAYARSSQIASSEGSFELFVWSLILLAFGAIGGETLGNGVVRELLQIEVDFGGLALEYGSVFSLAGFFAALPVVATFRFLRYIDARTKSDGWDIQIQLQRVALNAAAKGALRGAS